MDVRTYFDCFNDYIIFGYFKDTEDTKIISNIVYLYAKRYHVYSRYKNNENKNTYIFISLYKSNVAVANDYASTTT